MGPCSSCTCALVVTADDELENWVWLERLERKWSISKYGGKGRWKYRLRMSHSEQSLVGQHEETPNEN